MLELLPKVRLLELSRELGVVVKSSAPKDDHVGAIARKSPGALPMILRALGRDELKRACRAHHIDDRGRSREALAQRILGACNAANDSRIPSSVPSFRLMPMAGDIVAVRQRHYLVTDVVPATGEGTMTLVRLASSAHWTRASVSSCSASSFTSLRSTAPCRTPSSAC